MVLLETRGLSKRYGNVAALDGVTLSIKAGEVFCLLGPNGAGKTTLINLLLGFVAPSSGEAYIKGVDVATHPQETRRLTAYIPEQVMLYPTLTALENLRFFCALAGHRQYSESDLERFLAQTGLQASDWRRRVGGFSKGMRQKVGIAIALAKHAEALLLDEPTSGLDPSAASEFAALLSSMAARGCAVLMTTHDLFRAQASSSRIGILLQGRLVETFESADVDSSTLEQAYMRHAGTWSHRDIS